MGSLWKLLRSISLTGWILIGMAAGVLAGVLFPDASQNLRPLATIFLRIIKSMIVPLVFSTLVVGIAGHGDDMKRVGRLAVKSLVYFEIVTTLALLIGLGVVNLLQPGVGVSLAAPDSTARQLAQNANTVSGFFEHLVPQSFFEAAANNEVLQIVVFAVIFAAALTRVRAGRPKETMLAFCEGLAEVMFKFTNIIMMYAPVAIGAAIAVTVGHSGLQVLKNLGLLILALYLAIVIFFLAVLYPVTRIARVPLRPFLSAVKEPALIAFSTTSSEAALPRAMEKMEALGVPRRIVAFVLPTGYTFNLDGSALYLSLAAVFAAQAAGVHLTLGHQLLMMLTLMITSKGVAAVPRAALVILSATLVQFGLPLEAVAVVLGIDNIMDMGRTTVNLIGNCLASVVMARWEGEFQTTKT